MSKGAHALSCSRRRSVKQTMGQRLVSCQGSLHLKADLAIQTSTTSRSARMTSFIDMSSSQALLLIHECFAEMSCPPRESQKISSHSLKTTLLAWCARYGVKSSVRRQLGKHSDPRDDCPCWSTARMCQLI
eukprot:5955276-Amphidinium_carterae.1